MNNKKGNIGDLVVIVGGLLFVWWGFTTGFIVHPAGAVILIAAIFMGVTRKG